MLFRSIYFFSVFIFLLITGSIILTICTKEEVTLWVNAHYFSFLDMLVLTVNEMGRAWFCVVFIFVILIWKGWRTALNGAFCISGAVLVTTILKHLVFPGKPRPTLHFEGIADLRLLENVVQLQTETFPSGHTTAAFAMATFLALIISGKKFHWFIPIIAVLVGYSRIYLSQHFITDVYAGMTIGVVFTTIIFLTMQKIEKNLITPTIKH